MMNMEQTLTNRQRMTLDAIQWHRRQHGFSPTYRELGGILGITSTNGVALLVAELERKGVVRRDARKSRGIVPVAADVPLAQQWREMVLVRALLEQLDFVLDADGGVFPEDEPFLQQTVGLVLSGATT